jgi:arginyl-tRNA synthetase
MIEIVKEIIKEKLFTYLTENLNTTITKEQIRINRTNPGHEGDFTLNIFPFLKKVGIPVTELSTHLTEMLTKEVGEISHIETVGGYMNISLTDEFWITTLYDEKNVKQDTLLVEYSSPNTNKPLHLGHLRNNLVGWSVSELLKRSGENVKKVQIINDRGIHICKSMAAWITMGNGETPESTGMKSDYFVGKYYVLFNDKYKEELETLYKEGFSVEESEKKSPIMSTARELLLKWESGDKDTHQIWNMMNGWAYDGFEQTYDTIGVDFDKLYYESQTYEKGKEVIMEGLSKGMFEKDPDGSIWCDLSTEGLGRKLLLRSDGTSLYMTQDIGTALIRYEEHPDMKGVIYTVGDEQEHHFKTLFAILTKLGFKWANKCSHLSYGMVELPDGRMKSREGNVVEIDELVDEVKQKVRTLIEEKGRTNTMFGSEVDCLVDMIALGAIKYHILRIDPKKKMIFDPEESIQLQGTTGPFIQYTHARICSLLKMAGHDVNPVPPTLKLSATEKSILGLLAESDEVVGRAATEMNPAIVARHVYDLAKEYNRFYQEVPVIKEPDLHTRNFRLYLSKKTSEVIRKNMSLLGISVPERM